MSAEDFFDVDQFDPQPTGPVFGTMPDVLVDLETMGTRPNSPIIAIGAVAFDLRNLTLGERFYMNVDLDSSVKLGSVIYPDTVMWWLKQSDDARKSLTTGKRYPAAAALQGFSDWMMTSAVETRGVKVWGCGPDFDCVLLSEHYKKAGLEVPWVFWNQRDYRTVKSLYPNVEQAPRVGHHNSLYDAIHQVEHLFAIRRSLRGQG